jgi:hypothetical protein
MQPGGGEVSSLPDANAVFEGQQANGQTHREKRDTDRRDTEIKTRIKGRTQRGETYKRKRRDITEGDHRTDNRGEIKGPLRDITPEGPNTL